ncbi:MAG TPA: peptidyl-tRNA hydrolase [Actinocrinis sp.]|uniref:aminoacyl-tRNA hydrolase n=1 Tax=Actinocrinis sp. TaxID=1920516 RepID=UPI002DDD5584|nr:peptidyl-tRNA hydrolase [Actinocrinis sp.]HEV3168863.1 peptidyl-tRNA hydrolase [Actinocrinis sp.]
MTASDDIFEDHSDDRDAHPQYVLPLVVRLERDAPPTRTDALETAARAVLVLLADDRSRGEGEWAERVEAWQDARIRKVVRRARGAEWRRAEALPGITVTGAGTGSDTDDSGRAEVDGRAQTETGGRGLVDTDDSGRAEADGGADVEGGPATGRTPAQVRVFPPVPLDGWPKDLARLQVSGTELDDPETPTPPPPGIPVLWFNPAVKMTAGKAMAQAGHAAQLGWWSLTEPEARAWADAGFPLAVRTASPEQWDKLVTADLPTVRDAGFTEIAAGSTTAIAELRR